MVSTLESKAVTLQPKHGYPEVREDLRTVRESVESKISLGTAFPPYASRNSVVTSVPIESGSPFHIGELPDQRGYS